MCDGLHRGSTAKLKGLIAGLEVIAFTLMGAGGLESFAVGLLLLSRKNKSFKYIHIRKLMVMEPTICRGPIHVMKVW